MPMQREVILRMEAKRKFNEHSTCLLPRSPGRPALVVSHLGHPDHHRQSRKKMGHKHGRLLFAGRKKSLDLD